MAVLTPLFVRLSNIFFLYNKLDYKSTQNIAVSHYPPPPPIASVRGASSFDIRFKDGYDQNNCLQSICQKVAPTASTLEAKCPGFPPQIARHRETFWEEERRLPKPGLVLKDVNCLKE